MKAIFKKTMTAAVMAAVVGCGGFYASEASAVDAVWLKCYRKYPNIIVFVGTIDATIYYVKGKNATYSASASTNSNASGVKIVAYRKYKKLDGTISSSLEIASASGKNKESKTATGSIPTEAIYFSGMVLSNNGKNTSIGFCN